MVGMLTSGPGSSFWTERSWFEPLDRVVLVRASGSSGPGSSLWIERSWFEPLDRVVLVRASGSSGPGSSPGRGQCVTFLFSYSTSVYSDV